MPRKKKDTTALLAGGTSTSTYYELKNKNDATDFNAWTFNFEVTRT